MSISCAKEFLGLPISKLLSGLPWDFVKQTKNNVCCEYDCEYVVKIQLGKLRGTSDTPDALVLRSVYNMMVVHKTYYFEVYMFELLSSTSFTVGWSHALNLYS